MRAACCLLWTLALPVCAMDDAPLAPPSGGVYSLSQPLHSRETSLVFLWQARTQGVQEGLGFGLAASNHVTPEPVRPLRHKLVLLLGQPFENEGVQYRYRAGTSQEWLAEYKRRQLDPASPTPLPLVQRTLGYRYLWQGNSLELNLSDQSLPADKEVALSLSFRRRF
ncbi:hypothetical protein [Gallaecimonas xiamenensis]|uniref:Uncharacterized protein n=1 Tax=Gallaecimonas xiamenensis 3-C-1 TaxID=745411 RepID=K2K4R6_9GAMM|nr:hypothetical protein [Gallaecimonas xiamenensis]EKE77954.1 hypothetical protein B3C1_00800 [Gallaecimonas xiamenensis 3-C-1]